MLLNALFKLDFSMAPDINSLTSQHTITRRLILQQARHNTINSALTGCKLTVSGSISLSFSLFFSPFHHCTRSLSVTKEYLALEDGPPIFKQDFSCPALLDDMNSLLPVQDYHFLRSCFPSGSGQYVHINGLVRFRSPLLSESRLMSFPAAT